MDILVFKYFTSCETIASDLLNSQIEGNAQIYWDSLIPGLMTVAILFLCIYNFDALYHFL